MNVWKFQISIVFILLLSGCALKPRPRAPVPSPDGSMVAVPDITGEVLITITSKVGEVLHRWKTGASPYQWWDVKWNDNQSLLFESGDIGGYTLERQPDNSWRESTPGGLFSPDRVWKLQTSWDSQETKKLKLWFGEVTGHRSYIVRGEFQTNLVVADPFNCARWSGNNRVIIKTMTGEHAWKRSENGTWSQEE